MQNVSNNLIPSFVRSSLLNKKLKTNSVLFTRNGHMTPPVLDTAHTRMRIHKTPKDPSQYQMRSSVYRDQWRNQLSGSNGSKWKRSRYQCV